MSSCRHLGLSLPLTIVFLAYLLFSFSNPGDAQRFTTAQPWLQAPNITVPFPGYNVNGTIIVPWSAAAMKALVFVMGTIAAYGLGRKKRDVEFIDLSPLTPIGAKNVKFVDFTDALRALERGDAYSSDKEALEEASNIATFFVPDSGENKGTFVQSRCPERMICEVLTGDLYTPEELRKAQRHLTAHETEKLGEVVKKSEESSVEAKRARRATIEDCRQGFPCQLEGKDLVHKYFPDMTEIYG